ncbi:type IV pilus biogenesis protein PilM [Natranaerofaba carboxydovora]|uniref:type IV pilus biogenesis protein PilM n=1 Tax=Natranaerofaba carboxydovora TaxID=2742683 RepID=UPI001F13D863|nr:pilus assembly protein PilM [Natranaerofaba carboxydovora]
MKLIKSENGGLIIKKLKKKLAVRSPLGLDINDNSYKIVQLKRGKNGLVLNKFSDIELEEQDKENNLMNLKKIMAREKLTDKYFNMALKSTDVIIRQFDLPNMPEKELPLAVNYEARDQLIIPFDDVIYDFYKLGTDNVEAGKQKILLVAAKKEKCNEYYSFLKDKGFRLNSLEVDIFSVFRLVKYNNLLPKDETELRLILFMDDTNTALIISLGENYLYSRNISIGECDFFKVTNAELAKLTEKLIKEIEISINFARSQKSEIKKDYKVLFTGASCGIKGLIDLFQSKLHTTTKVVEPLEKIYQYEMSDEYYSGKNAAVAVGLSLRWWH